MALISANRPAMSAVRMAVLGAMLASPLLASAQQRMKVKPAKPRIIAPEKDPYLPYSGVTLDKGGEPPAPRKPPPGLQYVNWPGFRYEKEIGAEVFLQLTGPVSYKVKRKARGVDLTLDKTQVYLRNNLRPVITEHFPGPVTRFRLRRLRRNRIRLEIQLRQRATPNIALKTINENTYLVVTFPPTAGKDRPR